MNAPKNTDAPSALNLLSEPWLPVRSRSGSREWVNFSELSRPDLVAFDADRADFNGALAQLAVAVLQTVSPFQTPAQRKRLFDRPPDQATLAALLAPHNEYFRLDGDGTRFMQDPDLREGEAVPVSNLLIDAPGDSAQEKNTDHFVKRGRVKALCPHCAGLALFTLQTNAPAGGAGHRTSLRGGGPLTTLLLPQSGTQANLGLWHSLWLNVLGEHRLYDLGGDPGLEGANTRLPWLAGVQALQAEGGTVAPSQVHPVHALWGMPRRIRLDFDNLMTGTCSLCQRYSDRLVTQYLTRPQGLNYKGPWRHPLSPYYTMKEEQLPMHPQPGGLGYRHWLGLVLGMSNDKRHVDPAAVVTQHFQDPVLSRALGPVNLWCFGFDMDNMKARCWYESTMPLFHLGNCEPAAQRRLNDEVTAWVQGAELAASYLRSAVKTAWFSTDARGDFSHVDAMFWSQTERQFYLQLSVTIASLEAGALDDGIATKTAWLRQLQTAVLRLFDTDLVGAGPIEQQNMARVAKARHQLMGQLHGPKLRAALALPVEEKTKSARKGTAKVKATLD